MAERPIDQTLLDVLRCPACEDRPRVELKGDDALVCRVCGRTYPILNGIPVMLPDEEKGLGVRGW